MTVIINIIGVGRRSGKTTLIEAMTRELSKRFTIWTVKHISTSFDTADKDTWRHIQAGAKGVIAVTNCDIVIIKRNKASFEMALEEIPKNVNLILVEGFKESNYPKIIAAQKVYDVRKVLSVASQVFAIYETQVSESDEKKIEGIPVISKVETLISKVEEMILNDAKNKLPVKLYPKHYYKAKQR